jgi:hypothetical protein
MGKTRRRRQHGGGVCKWVLIGALATLSGAHADDIGFLGRVSNWWNNPKPWDTEPSVELANYIVDKKWAPSLNIYPDSCVIPSGIRTEEDVTKVVEPYLKEVTVYGMKNNHKYRGKDGRVFELETWTNNQNDTYTLSVRYDDSSSEGIIVNNDDTFEVVPKDGGGKKKRRGQRKTLRRKK